MNTKTRRPIAAANWKMNLLHGDAQSYCKALRDGLLVEGAEAVLFPPATLLATVSAGLTGVAASVGGQDLHPAAKGAHTGDLSGPQLADAGCTWVLCGHSERRTNYGETDELVGQKARAAVEHGLVPLVCLGETEDQRRAGRTFEVLARQLLGATRSLSTFELAYEPVWAIGTGQTATPEIAQEAHRFLRIELEKCFDKRRADGTRILYGGSANPENAGALIAMEDIDGFLIGGASLDSSKFLAMINACGGTG